MKIMNFGSLNIDKVYQVRDFVRPGETIAAEEYHIFAGGKGLNQSIALARAGSHVLHAGKIGKDGLFLKELLEKDGVDCRFLKISDTDVSGHAVIQVSRAGENCIVLFGGANRTITDDEIDRALSFMEKGDYLLLQNEISRIREIMERAAEKGLRIFFNPAPMKEEVKDLPLHLIDTLIVNETEATSLAGTEKEHALEVLKKRYPELNILMTLGSEGSLLAEAGKDTVIRVSAQKAEKVIDTTAAGDTYIGYYLAGRAAGKDPEESMNRASQASAICVGIAGAANSIPKI